MRSDTSRSQTKRADVHLQRLGDALIGWPVPKLAAAELPAKLHEAVRAAQGMERSTLRRQRLYIGRLLRELPPEEIEPIRDLIAREAKGRLAEGEANQRVVAWRDRLLKEGETAVAALTQAFVRIDAEKVRTLVLKANRAAEMDRGTLANRQLYRYLRGLVDSAAAKAPVARRAPARDETRTDPETDPE